MRTRDLLPSTQVSDVLSHAIGLELDGVQDQIREREKERKKERDASVMTCPLDRFVHTSACFTVTFHCVRCFTVAFTHRIDRAMTCAWN